MKRIQAFRVAVLTSITLLGCSASASPITIETVAVGDIGNNADPLTGYGSVSYAIEIGKYEVTNTQYAAFLNQIAKSDPNGLYNTDMNLSPLGGITRGGGDGSYSYTVKSGFGNKPVNYVSFWDATRFVNWLSNGQGIGDTETGSYTLTPAGISGNTVTRNSGASWVVPNDFEWYKAAYYDPTKGGSSYWLHATRSDTLALNTAFTAANGANYRILSDYANGGSSGPGTTDVGAYSNAGSFYGTFDQGGNVSEWNDPIAFVSSRGYRGGSWFSQEEFLRSTSNGALPPSFEWDQLGFRVANLVPIPEPSTYAAAMGAMALGAVMMRRRKARGTF